MHPLENPDVLLVASFTSLMAFDPVRVEWTLLHQGQGKYYGMVALDDHSVAVVSRPQQGLPDDLLIFDRQYGTVQRSVSLESIDTHQIARTRDRLYIADTGQGRVLVMSPTNLADPPAVLAEFAVNDHVNSIRPAAEHVDLLLHKSGPSDFVRVDVKTGREVLRVEGVGRQSHDLEPWNDKILVCASALGGIVAVDPTVGDVESVWQDDASFTKGLAVVGDIAWFGRSTPSNRAERWTRKCELVALDISTGTVVDRFEVPQDGLVNAIAHVGRMDTSRR